MVVAIQIYLGLKNFFLTQVLCLTLLLIDVLKKLLKPQNPEETAKEGNNSYFCSVTVFKRKAYIVSPTAKSKKIIKAFTHQMRFVCK